VTHVVPASAIAFAFSSAPAVLVTLVACLILLALRTWCLATGLVLSRQVFLLLDGAIGALMVLFLGLVVMRFAYVG
jgi:hypothetical protein